MVTDKSNTLVIIDGVRTRFTVGSLFEPTAKHVLTPSIMTIHRGHSILTNCWP